MRRLLLMVIAFVLLIPNPIDAQGSRLYKLHVPTVSEYLYLLSTTDARNSLTVGDTQNIIHDFVRQYVNPDPSVSFTDLVTVYRQIYHSSNPVIMSSDLSVWNAALISAWLKEHLIDISSTPQFSFQIDHLPRFDSNTFYQINAVPYDFKGDNSSQWLLTTSIKESDTSGDVIAINYLLATRDEADVYHVLTLPMPWLADAYGTFYDQSNSWLDLWFERDLLGDGRTELVFSSKPAARYSIGALHVFMWQDGQMVDRATITSPMQSEGVALPSINSTIMAVPSQIAHKYTILIKTTDTDNWGCLHNTMQIVGWNRTQWLPLDAQLYYFDMAGCYWRKAESAMWDAHYQTAIADYQAGLLKVMTDAVKPDPEMMQYVQFRLALAYLLSGQPLQASLLSTSLKFQSPQSEIMRELINDLPLRPASNPYPICVKVWNVFQKYDYHFSIVRDDQPDPDAYLYVKPATHITVGRTQDTMQYLIEFLSPHGQPLPDPKKAGCNITSVLLSFLESQTFNTKVPLTTQLHSMGIGTTGALSLDINQNRQPEWLIWLTIAVPPLHFMLSADKATYSVSYAPFNIHRPEDYSDLISSLNGSNDLGGIYRPPAPASQPAPMGTALVAWDYEKQFDTALKRKDYLSALKFSDQALLTLCEHTCDLTSVGNTKSALVNIHLWRAVALAFSGRDSEAVSEYLFVAENATSPAQYALAMLHLQPRDF